MKIKALATALLIAGSLGAATTASAQYRDYDRSDYRSDRSDRSDRYERRFDRDGDGRLDRYERRQMLEAREDRRDDRRYDRRYERRYYATQRYQPRTRWVAPRGYRGETRWVVGRSLPTGYYGSNYYVSDYRGYNLVAPQRGYRWVRVDRDVYLVDLRTGLVADVRYDLFY